MGETFRPVFSTHGHARKTHLAVNDGDPLCGIYGRHPDLMWTSGSDMPLTVEAVSDYIDCDAGDVCCKRCKQAIRKEPRHDQ